MTGPDTQNVGSPQCPECGGETEDHPIFDMFLCDDCEIAVNAEGEVAAR